MPYTINEEKLEFKSWINENLDILEEVPNIYYDFVVEFYPNIVIIGEKELSDEEILSLPEKTGIFSFLDDNEEKIYTENDGIPLE